MMSKGKKIRTLAITLLLALAYANGTLTLAANHVTPELPEFISPFAHSNFYVSYKGALVQVINPVTMTEAEARTKRIRNGATLKETLESLIGTDNYRLYAPLWIETGDGYTGVQKAIYASVENVAYKRAGFVLSASPSKTDTQSGSRTTSTLTIEQFSVERDKELPTRNTNVKDLISGDYQWIIWMHGERQYLALVQMN